MNHITIELCAEDRKRLDDLAYGLGVVAGLLAQTPKATEAKLADKREAETTTEPQEAKEETTQATTPPAEEIDPDAIPSQMRIEEITPSITLGQIQQKVIQLSANAQKKEAARSIIFTYGTKVSDLKDQPEKWDEVWEKLTTLEKEA